MPHHDIRGPIDILPSAPVLNRRFHWRIPDKLLFRVYPWLSLSQNPATGITEGVEAAHFGDIYVRGGIPAGAGKYRSLLLQALSKSYSKGGC